MKRISTISGKPVLGSNGFTLQEIIWVIVIVGILMTVAILRYLDMSDHAKRATCLQNQYALEQAETLYYTESIIQDGNGSYTTDIDKLIPYLQAGTIPICPDRYDYILGNDGSADCESPDHHRP